MSNPSILNVSQEINNDEDLPDMYHDLRETVKGQGVEVAHINIRGLLNKVDEIRVLLQECKFFFRHGSREVGHVSMTS